MKRTCFTLLLTHLASILLSQEAPASPNGKITASANPTQLAQAIGLNDLSPDLWQHMVLPASERAELERRSKGSFQGYDVFPAGINYFSPKQPFYNGLIDYLSVKISTVQDGKVVSAESHGDLLSSGQKRLLADAGVDDDIRIDVRFRHRQLHALQASGSGRVIEGSCTLTVVPELEACYPGGLKSLRDQLSRSVLNQLADDGAKRAAYASRLSRCILQFIVDENGLTVEPFLRQGSGDAYIDALLIEATKHVDLWKPAKNKSGKPVKQPFTLSLNSDGC